MTRKDMKNKFFVVGRGFIFPKHEEAIRSIGGKIVKNIKNAEWVVILTPNNTHYQLILNALKHKKKVLCEKPLVLTSGECKNLIGKPAYSVFQLRYLPIKIKPLAHNTIEIVVFVHRDDSYFNTWRGKNEESGGILFNLGIHYFDLIFKWFGYPKEQHVTIVGPKENSGWFKGKNYDCVYSFSYKADKNNQKRLFRINGTEFNLESKTNLHKFVYKDLIGGRAIKPKEVLKTIKFIEKLNLNG